ncbi:MAG: ankyrin repeat domain-containing protein [Chlorobia bacterium]|nr:ankyrin repeat domain-containing protein [Fimbriimonadaceae bacterium]
MRPGILALAVSLPWAGMVLATPAQHQQDKRRSTDPPIAAKGKLGQDLFMAVGRRDLVTVQSLLKQGADANARNGLEFTPLYIAAASHNAEAMKALLDAGAQPDADSPYGTALTFAAMTGNADGARMLFAKGAKADTARVDGDTVLMMAAQAGNPDFIAEMLKRKVDVNATSYNGSSALSYAARMGHVEVGRMLLEAGAKPDLADTDKQTPLMIAAKAGHPEFVKMLLKRGAKVNIRDKKGWTPLMFAAGYGDSPDSVRALVGAGANAGAKDSKGRTAATLASDRGYRESAEVLGGPKASAKTRNARKAAATSLILLEKSMTAFSRGTACISCHQEGLGRMTTASAKLRGMLVDRELEKAQIGRLRGALGALQPLHEQALANPEVMKQVPLIEINETTPGYSWMLAGMAAQNDQPNAATSAIAMVLARQQSPDGSWTFSLPRVPMQSSVFTYTAIAARSLNAYGPKANASETKNRLGKAKTWLLNTPAKTSDDLAFRLLGLKWTGATIEERRKAIDELLAGQRPDGGWSQMPGMHSDAYATGQALYALAVAGGVQTSSAEYQRGVKYLLRTQDDDGSWFVNKRAIPANNYFDAEFPHGESQYASFNGTCWATLALLETMPKK